MFCSFLKLQLLSFTTPFVLIREMARTTRCTLNFCCNYKVCRVKFHNFGKYNTFHWNFTSKFKKNSQSLNLKTIFVLYRENNEHCPWKPFFAISWVFARVKNAFTHTFFRFFTLTYHFSPALRWHFLRLRNFVILYSAHSTNKET